MNLRFNKHLVRQLSMLLMMAFAWTISLANAEVGLKDYQIKASYLYHFINFIDWPENKKNNKSMNICIYGGDPFFGALDRINEREIKGKIISVKYLNQREHLNECHIVYINAINRDTFNLVLSALDDLPIVTVGDMNAFAKQGGMIGLNTLNNKIKLEINLDAMKRVKIKASSNLLEIASIVSNSQ